MKKIKLNVPKINKEKIKKRLDWSKLNFRKLNWLTILALLSYLHILVVIPLIFGRKSQFVQFHVRQGLILLAFWILFQVSIFLPILPWFLALYILVSIVYGIISVVTGRRHHLLLIANSTALVE